MVLCGNLYKKKLLLINILLACVLFQVVFLAYARSIADDFLGYVFLDYIPF